MKEEIIAFLAEKSKYPAEKITCSTPLLELNVDSLVLLDTVLEFEKKFHIKISDRELGSLTTVGDLADLLNRHRTA